MFTLKIPKCKNLIDKKMTILIMADAKKQTANLLFPWWVLVSTIILACCFALAGVYFAINFFCLKDEVNHLGFIREENQKQAKEIASLQAKTREMEEKLQSVDVLNKEVRALVGLEEENRGEAQPVLPVRREVNNLSSRGGESDFFDELHGHLSFIEERAELQSLKLAELKSDVQKQLDYLAHIPDLWPLKGKITDSFGYRKSPFSRRREFHSGIDIKGNRGDAVVAAADGTVVLSERKVVWGNLIVINHGNGYKTYYAHNSKLVVQAGEKVKKGQMIAKVGSTRRSTGPHLHFGIEKNGEFIDPLTVLTD